MCATTHGRLRDTTWGRAGSNTSQYSHAPNDPIRIPAIQLPCHCESGSLATVEHSHTLRCYCHWLWSNNGNDDDYKPTIHRAPFNQPRMGECSFSSRNPTSMAIRAPTKGCWWHERVAVFEHHWEHPCSPFLKDSYCINQNELHFLQSTTSTLEPSMTTWPILTRRIPTLMTKSSKTPWRPLSDVRTIPLSSIRCKIVVARGCTNSRPKFDPWDRSVSDRSLCYQIQLRLSISAH